MIKKMTPGLFLIERKSIINWKNTTQTLVFLSFKIDMWLSKEKFVFVDVCLFWSFSNSGIYVELNNVL